MQFFRLIKPNWAKKYLANGEQNPDFVQEINGDNVIEGCNFSHDYLQQKNAEGYNVYFFPNHPSKDVYADGKKYLSGRLIDTFNYVFVDMDLKDNSYSCKEEFLYKLSEFSLRPTMVVDSGNGIHAYWKVKDLKREQYVLTQMALLTYFKTDQSVWTVLQLMRLPQFYNTKDPSHKKLASILNEYSSNNEYNISDFPKEIFNLSQEKVNKVQNHINRLDGKLEVKLDRDLNIDELPDKFVDLMIDNIEVQNLFNNPKSYKNDRSAADMKLANVLFSNNFNRKEALQVLANTEKALEKGANRYDYADLTIDKVYSSRINNKFRTASEIIRQSKDQIREAQVYGPYYMDYGVLGQPWRKNELLGIIAGSGVGKTEVALNIVKHQIENNKDNDDVFIFFSLEMSDRDIVSRWIDLVGRDSPLADRLYVIDNRDNNGNPRNMGIQEIYEYSRDIIKMTGKKLGSIIVDHMHQINTQIDLSKKLDFKVKSEMEAGWSNIQNISVNNIASMLKSLVQTLNTFGIILTQTTKGKGVGDLPIAKDGAYGISQYEWIMDRIITIWQPLMRVQNKTQVKFTAFQYVKIREKSKRDKIFENDPKLLTYNMDTRELTVTSPEEYSVFKSLIEEANQKRKEEQEKKGTQYSIQVDLKEVDSVLSKIRAVK